MYYFVLSVAIEISLYEGPTTDKLDNTKMNFNFSSTVIEIVQGLKVYGTETLAGRIFSLN